MDRLRQEIRVRHYSIRTEEAYTDWVRRFIVFHGKRHPSELGAAAVASGSCIQSQPMASLTGLPTRLSISTKVSMVNLAVFLFTTSEIRGRETIRIWAASACLS